MARLKDIIEIILLVSLGECAYELTKCVPWVPEDIFFLIIRGNEARSAEEKELLISTVNTVYFILGVLKRDLWSQGAKCVVWKKKL